MRHRLHSYRLGKKKDQRKALMSNLSVSLFIHGMIHTTLIRAKALRPHAERLITKAKMEDKLHARRTVASRLFNNFEIAEKLVSNIAVSNKSRPGGYTRIVRTGYRKGDGAPTALIELVEPFQGAEPKKATDDNAVKSSFKLPFFGSRAKASAPKALAAKPDLKAAKDVKAIAKATTKAEVKAVIKSHKATKTQPPLKTPKAPQAPKGS